MIDSTGRIVFDSSDDTGDDPAASKKQDEDLDDIPEDGEEDVSATVREDSIMQDIGKADGSSEQDKEIEEGDVEIDLLGLRRTFFPDLSRLEELDVCPSLKTFTLGDPSGSLDIPFLRAPEDWKQDQEHGGAAAAHGDISGLLIEGDAPAGFDDDDLGLGSFDMGDDVAFGEGGEAWAREAALDPQTRMYGGGMGADDGADGDQYDDNGEYIVSMDKAQNADQMHEDILGFFDQALQKNWSSAEHWRIRKIKDASKPATETKKRKEKEAFEIDFASPLDTGAESAIYTQASSNSAISMPKKDWISKSRNLLPDDKHFNSKSLLSLFLKPKARLMQKKTTFGGRPDFGNIQDDVGDMPMDEAFWANQKAPLDNDDAEPQGDYDANFFQDDQMPFADGDDDDDLEFADAREHFSPMDGDAGMTENVGGLTAMLGGDTMNPMGGAFGHTLVTNATRRVRPDYVQYARVAKKVDVRRLKEEIWKGMEFDNEQVSTWLTARDNKRLTYFLQPPPELSHLPTPEPESEPQTPKDDKSLKFTNVMNGLKTVYPKPIMEDISTSFCFIALLHLANEKGLVINKSEDLSELSIRRDWTAEVTEE